MAIQLSDRDNLIFKFIEEHQVLLEKHIAWFISIDDKPVLIRDRLRKLFYLDYLLCERHGGKLPWWTTPTKPLVYILSPMTRQLMSMSDNDSDLFDCETQRHLLEIANLRMLFLVDQKENVISDLEWTTIRQGTCCDCGLHAMVSFKKDNSLLKVGILNSAEKTSLLKTCEKAFTTAKVDQIWVVSRDDSQQQAVQDAISGSALANKIVFATHQEIYKSGMARTKWQAAGQHTQTRESMPINMSISAAQAFS